ncbi:YaiI/YqxD family protein [Nioella nitratireducens]|uniref:YaiI/YqxD family protein n=1 Tax=Nioella nitratireducens TaxID=1287720 RepID=UPI0008FD3D97|nr:YaiI/YqxD family protein [Nioella nitratireducens]
MILVDADACPVKQEAIRVALRHQQSIVFVANQGLRLPDHPLIRQFTVSDGFDAADDAIAEASGPGVLVITADILLAERCLKVGAAVLGHRGDRFTMDGIGGQIATRAIMADLRAGLDGQGIGGQRPFSKGDRSRFLEAMETALRQLPR